MSRSVERAMRNFHLCVADLKAPLLDKAERQRLAATVRQQHGIEMTPDEAEGHLRDALWEIRRRMVLAGHPEFATMPAAEVRRIMHEAMG